MDAAFSGAAIDTDTCDKTCRRPLEVNGVETKRRQRGISSSRGKRKRRGRHGNRQLFIRGVVERRQ